MPNLRVLVVDDEPLIQKVLKEYFRQRHDECDAAGNGEEALRMAEDRIYDLVLSDISMPGMDGLELIRRIKVVQPQSVCILMSGYGTRGDIISALKIGVFDFIDKPLPDLASLTMVVDRAAESGRLVRERDALLENLREQNSKLEYSLLRLHEAFRQMHEQDEALASDLHKAQRLQRKFLPAGFPRVPGFDFFGFYAPCDQLSGDFFGTIPLPNDRFALYLVDVAGHGVSAAMITLTFRELMRSHRHSGPGSALFEDPAAVLRHMNDALLEENFEPPIYVSMVYCVIDFRSGEINLACAGHPAPILVSGADRVSAVSVEGTVLGAQTIANYTTAHLRLNAGDSLLFYSDGLSEVRNADGDELGAARLQEIVGSRHNHPARAVAEHLEHQLREHLNGTASLDDITFLVVSRGVAGAPMESIHHNQLDTDSVKIVQPEKVSVGGSSTHGQVHGGFVDQTCVLQLSGVMSWQLAPTFREMLHLAKNRAAPPFHLDLTRCESMDSTMLGLLLLHASELILHQPGARVIDQLHEMGVLHLLTISHETCPQPQVVMDITPKKSQMACSDLILCAHEALMDASASNRKKFKDVVETLRDQKAKP
jgi:sigma-B regulation protein RsbU (phosphoserine phosphatase)